MWFDQSLGMRPAILLGLTIRPTLEKFSLGLHNLHAQPLPPLSVFQCHMPLIFAQADASRIYDTGRPWQNSWEFQFLSSMARNARTKANTDSVIEWPVQSEK